jgi:hypothetical protein
LTWAVESPGWTALNPSTRGVFRVQGTARSPRGEETAWTAVLKVLGDTDYPGSTQPHEFNYWRREPLALQSDLLQQREAGLVPVEALEVAEPVDGEVWLWLECLDATDAKPRWGSADQLAAARDLGSFNGVWSPDPPSVQQHPWLAEHWLRGWLAYALFFGAQHAVDDESCWQHPVVAAALPAGMRSRYLQLMVDAAELLQVLESRPVTLTHHDAQWRNLFARPAGTPRYPHASTVAIDWGFLGLAPVGADLGHMLGCDLEHGAAVPRQPAAYDAAVTTAYLNGLAGSGWRGDEREMRFARAVSAALQMAPAFAAQLAWLQGEPAALGLAELAAWPDDLAAREQTDVESAMAGWAALFSYLLDLGDEARALAAQIG